MGDKCCEKEIRISFCPACKSRDVRYVFGLANLFGIIPKMKCLECGFSSISFPVLITTEEKLKMSVENMKAKNNTSRRIRESIATNKRKSSSIKKIVGRGRK